VHQLTAEVASLKPRIDSLTLKGEYSEDAFMYPEKRFWADESFKSFNTQSKLAKCQRAFG
jgi:hypothetical protein